MRLLITFLSISSLLMANLPLAYAKALPAANFNNPVLEDFSDYTNPFSDTHLLMNEGKAAAELYRRGISSGYPDGEFKGYREVNRAEITKFLLIARYGALLKSQKANPFSDIKASHWFTPFVIASQEMGIVSGYPDGTFKAGDSVNTVEFLKMFAKTFSLPDKLPHNYIDVSEGVWYTDLAGVASTYNLFPEREKYLDPNRKLTRTEVAIALYNYFKLRGEVEVTPENTSKDKVEATAYAHHKLGNINGDVNIDIFGNLGGKHTLELYENLLKVQEAYSEEVKITWNYFPKSSYNVAEYEAGNAAECASEQDKFWEFLDVLLRQEPSAFNQALYLSIGENLELERSDFEACIIGKDYIGRVQHDKEQATNDKLTVIPSFYINGKTHSGSKSYETIETLVKEELGL